MIFLRHKQQKYEYPPVFASSDEFVSVAGLESLCTAESFTVLCTGLSKTESIKSIANTKEGKAWHSLGKSY